MVLDSEMRLEIHRLEIGMSEDFVEFIREQWEKGNERRMFEILSEYEREQWENEEES